MGAGIRIFIFIYVGVGFVLSYAVCIEYYLIMSDIEPKEHKSKKNASIACLGFTLSQLGQGRRGSIVAGRRDTDK